MNKKGFTLVEVLVVVLIIGILAGVAIPQYRKVVERSRFTRAQVMAKAIYDSAERVMATWGVESWSSVPAAEGGKNKIYRLDIINGLLEGATIDDDTGQISLKNFTYVWDGDYSQVYITSEKNGTQIGYNGQEFSCLNPATHETYCDIYGVD